MSMAKRKFQLTGDQASELLRAYASCKDGPTRTRYQVYACTVLATPVLKSRKSRGVAVPV